ncbi:hypothetical protein WJX74_006946 [Apatococcus lobatus]|uniref:SET domain-containing protein n=1 Tax=Apatococcus lobatus TaxID=904363 RepID=A0AAW1RKM5_9CHLO
MTVEVRTVPGKGRGLFSTRHISAGESILDELPVVLTVSHALKQSYCSVCLRFIPSEALSACLCGTCQEACCCSTGCAAHHNAELCRLLAHLDWTGLNRELQDSLRLVAQLQCMANDAASRDILQQLSQLAAMPADGPGAQLLASRLAAVLQPQQQGLSAEAVQTLMGTEAMNGFGIAAHASMNAGRDQIRGSVLCLQASMMNHDCLPNAARFDDFDSPGEHNNRLSFRALQDIPAGEEITHQYFPLDWSLEERQEQCREVFGFQCNCGRCQVEQQWEAEENDMEDAEDDFAEPSSSNLKECMTETSTDGIDSSYVQMFLLRYLCPLDACGGTLAPIAGTDTQECNRCSHRRTNAEFLAELEAEPEDLSD